MAKTGWVWDGTQFVALTAPVGAFPNAVGNYASTTPTSPKTGQIWFDTVTLKLKVYNGSAWLDVVSGASGSGSNKVFYENDTAITVDYTITTGKNAMTAGPVTINSGVTVTIPDGSSWVIA